MTLSCLIQADCTFLVNINPIWQPIKIPSSQSKLTCGKYSTFTISKERRKEENLQEALYVCILIWERCKKENQKSLVRVKKGLWKSLEREAKTAAPWASVEAKSYLDKYTFILICANHYFHICKVSISQHFPGISKKSKGGNIFLPQGKIISPG